MGIRFSDHDFISFQKYIEESERPKKIPYSHPIDKWIIDRLNSSIAKPLIERAVEFVVSVQLGPNLTDHLTVEKKTFPQIFQILNLCANTLEIPIPLGVIKKNDIYITSSVGTDKYAVIYISLDQLELFSTQEKNFIIGCECGQIATGQIFYHTLVSFLTGVYPDLKPVGLLQSALLNVAGSALPAWSQRSQVTADRAGLLCCKDINIAETALLKITTGTKDVMQIDIEDYLNNYEKMAMFHNPENQRLGIESQLSIPKRIKALRLFANSQLYYQLLEQPQPSGNNLLNREELDRQVNVIVQSQPRSKNF